MFPLALQFPLLKAINNSFPGVLPIAVAAVLAYIAAKAMADSLCGADRTQGGKLAIGHWIPIAMLAIAAGYLGQPEIAIGLIFSSSIACLSLALGSVAFLDPVQLANGSRRSWTMLVPTAMMTFLIGIHGSITLFNAGLLALQGVCVLMFWNDRSPTTPAAPIPVTRPERGVEIRAVQFVLALAMAGAGVWLARRGVIEVAASAEYASVGLLTATLLGPMLILPIIGTGTELAHQHQSSAAISAQVGVALLNLCALLPLTVLAGAFHVSFGSTPIHWPSVSFDSTFAMHFPLAVWRVDVILLIVLGLVLMPVALGRWSVTRMQGVLMMLGYLFYLVMTLVWERYATQGVVPNTH